MPFGTEKVSGRTTLPPMRVFHVYVGAVDSIMGEEEPIEVFAHSLEIAAGGQLVFYMASIEDGEVVVKMGHMFNVWEECKEVLPTSVTVN